MEQLSATASCHNTVDHCPVRQQHQHGSHRAHRPPAETGPAPDRDDVQRTAPDGNIEQDPDRQGDQSDMSAELSVNIGEGPGGVHQVFVKM